MNDFTAEELRLMAVGLQKLYDSYHDTSRARITMGEEYFKEFTQGLLNIRDKLRNLRKEKMNGRK